MPRRGEVVTIAAKATFAGKPRPALVVQSDLFQELSTTVVLMFTTHAGYDPLLRPEFMATPANGLLETSRLMIHAPTTVRHDDIGKVIGAMTAHDMAEIDRKLMMMLFNP